jgi:hypothetical protein
MPRRTTYTDPDDDDLPDGVYHDDDLPTVPCPYCRREILEEANRCPYCENYISAEDSPPARKSVFWIVLMVLALAVSVLWVLG